MTKRARRLFLPLAGAICLALLSQTAWAIDITLGWDPNPEPDLAGYAVYVKKNSPPGNSNLYGHVAVADLEDPDSPYETISDLKSGSTYYIALKAYNSASKYSQFSEPICIQVAADDSVGLCSEAGGGGSSSGGSGGGGSQCFIASAADSAPVGGAAALLALTAGLWFARRR